MAKSVDKVYPGTQGARSDFVKSTKRLPIVVCLDVSPSMFNYDRYMAQSLALREFLKRIAQVKKAWDVVEIAFMTFADDIILKTDFMALQELHFPQEVATQNVEVVHETSSGVREHTMVVPYFEPLRREACTELPRAVGAALRLLRERMESLKKSRYSYYTPFLVVVTDGNPDSRDYQSMESVGYRDEENKVYGQLARWCNPLCAMDKLILPFFVGIGGEGVDFTSLRRLAGNLPGGLCIVDDSEDSVYQLGRVFTAMASAISKSVSYSTTQELLRVVETEISEAKSKL